MESQYDPAASEHLYVQLLEHYFQSALPNAKFIIDTGRNGVDGMRSECANWCARGGGRVPCPCTPTRSGFPCCTPTRPAPVPSPLLLARPTRCVPSRRCNIRGAGVGRLPTAATDLPAVDAYFWLKTPGEAAGCTATLPSPPGGACARFDSFCGSDDSIGSRARSRRVCRRG